MQFLFQYPPLKEIKTEKMTEQDFNNMRMEILSMMEKLEHRDRGIETVRKKFIEVQTHLQEAINELCFIESLIEEEYSEEY